MGSILISGGAGFLGSHMCDRLLAEGHDVLCADNCITGRKANIAHLEGHDRFAFINQDVAKPFHVDRPLDFVLHLASPASPPDFKRIPFETMAAGSYATHNLLEIARENGARFFLASTSEIYGDPPPEHHPQVESYFGNVNTLGTRAVYDEAKRYAEALTMAYQREHRLETRIVRIFNTYGPRMRPDDGRVVTNFICQALRGEPLTLHGDGSQTRSFCFVSDLIDGMYRLVMSDESMPVNIGNPGEFTMRELAEKIRELTASTSEIGSIPQPFPDDPRQRKPDITKAKNVLGWEPNVSLEEGLKKTIEYLRNELGY
jgi:dTDP-glucose 4,6-dehydratase